ncbi:MAG TPA: exosortase/archaeosortase family protein [Bryobacteraceae bacterium]|nr:exosortase/archaeosortase family protein [Bryobacteraceae bacterium]
MRRIVAILAIAALALCYAPTIRGTVHQWWTDEDMGYAFLVPVVIAWIVWRDRDRLRKLPVRGSGWGFTLLALAASLQVASVLGAGLFAGSLAFVLSLAGVLLCLLGWAWLRALAFPLILTLFMLPKLAVVYNQVTLPLQLLATRLAGGMLAAVGFMVVRDGNILNVAGHSIAVVEACDGIRYLLPLGFLALVFAYTAGARPWLRVGMLAAAIPTAIVANAMRVAFSGLSPTLTSGVPHELLGTLIFVLCLGLLAGIYRLFRFVPDGTRSRPRLSPHR